MECNLLDNNVKLLYIDINNNIHFNIIIDLLNNKKIDLSNKFEWERLLLIDYNFKIYAKYNRGVKMLPINKKVKEIFNINVRGPIIITN